MACALFCHNKNMKHGCYCSSTRTQIHRWRAAYAIQRSLMAHLKLCHAFVFSLHRLHCNPIKHVNIRVILLFAVGLVQFASFGRCAISLVDRGALPSPGNDNSDNSDNDTFKFSHSTTIENENVAHRTPRADVAGASPSLIRMCNCTMYRFRSWIYIAMCSTREHILIHPSILLFGGARARPPFIRLLCLSVLFELYGRKFNFLLSSVQFE